LAAAFRYLIAMDIASVLSEFPGAALNKMNKSQDRVLSREDCRD
jgi:hypothetical protein